jgi:hypothetical protein
VGTPDYFGCVAGWFVALEQKGTAKDKLTKLQELNLHKVNKAGGFGLRCDPENWTKVKSFLETLNTMEKTKENENYLRHLAEQIFCPSPC